MPKLSNIFYIEPARCFFYGNSTQEIMQLDFPLEIARDSEVVSKEKLSALIQAFLQTNNIAPSNATIVMSPLLTFEKDLTGMTVPQQTVESQSFLETVPFENVSFISANVGPKKMLVATNKDFIDALHIPLSTQGFSMPAVIPFSLLSLLAPELQTNLDLKIVFQKIDMAHQYNFLTPQEQPHTEETFTSKPKNMTRVYLLAGVFALLLIILGYVAFTNLTPPKPAPSLLLKDRPLPPAKSSLLPKPVNENFS